MSTNQRNPEKKRSESRTFLTEIFNSYFNLTPSSARTRLFFMLLCFFGIWILLVFSSSLILNESNLLSIFSADNDFSTILGFILKQFINPLVLTRLIVIVLAYITALHFSGLYLKTIYQLNSGKACKHILANLAFDFPFSDSVSIEDGKMATTNWNSYLHSFGGPGKARIGFDSGVVLECSNGIAEIIGPTSNLPSGYFNLKPFEKIRKIFNLRSHTLSFDLLARTSDCIPIRIKNMHLTFSVLRGTNKVTLTKPYPFSSQAIYWLVFLQPNYDFLDVISDIAKTTLLEIIREYEFDKIFPLSEIPFLIKDKNFPHFIQEQESRQKRRLFTFRKMARFPLPKKSRFSQIYLFRPILHHPHHQYIEQDQKQKEVTLPITVSRCELSSTLLDKFEMQFMNHLKQPGINFKLISLGTWSPILVSSHTQPNHSTKSLSFRESSPRIENNHQTKEIKYLLKEFFGDSEHDFKPYSSMEDINHLDKILKFLKMKFAANATQSWQNQDILEKAIINLEKSIKED